MMADEPALAKGLELLREQAAALGLQLSDRQLALFDRYYHELIAWNQRVNLTAITDPLDVCVKHFLDSLTVYPLAQDASVTGAPRLVDVGSGGGFPGLPLAIVAPELQVTLLDSMGKRTAFLQHVVETLELPNVSVVTARAEEAARRPEFREEFDLAACRAVDKLAVLVEYLLPLGRIGGRAVAMKRGDIQAEIDSAQHAIVELSGRLDRIVPVTLPALDDNRCLVIIEKTAATPERYPRRPGIPVKRPL